VTKGMKLIYQALKNVNIHPKLIVYVIRMSNNKFYDPFMARQCGGMIWLKGLGNLCCWKSQLCSSSYKNTNKKNNIVKHLLMDCLLCQLGSWLNMASSEKLLMWNERVSEQGTKQGLMRRLCVNRPIHVIKSMGSTTTRIEHQSTVPVC